MDEIKSTTENVNTSLKKTELSIEGMSCAACSASVERSTRKLEGVASAQVNLTTNRGFFEYDPSKVKLSEIKAAIEKAGFIPHDVEGEKTRDLEREQREHEVHVMRIRLIIAAVFSAPVLYIAMSH
ncbi:MAG: cation-translocating P-type ATPase, partial [Clostridiales bacterium]|nr:cation-translocating P-type ATPase [Clostridiales bacterium]